MGLNNIGNKVKKANEGSNERAGEGFFNITF
jgi:hypothetical protein